MNARFNKKGTRSSRQFALVVLAACAPLFSCSPNPGPCFGIDQEKSYTLTVIDRYDENSQFKLDPQAAPGEPENVGCGAPLQFPNNTKLVATVLGQFSEEGCLVSFVRLDGTPAAFTFPGGFLRNTGSEANENVFVASARAVVSGCPGGLSIRVKAPGQDPTTGNPFLSSAEGGVPKVVMSEFFQASAAGSVCDSAVVPAGQGSGGDAPRCLQYYAIQIEPN